MSIRNSAKAIIVHENRVLLNQSHRDDFGDYYVLPGGGQNQYETMEDAVVRECLEETGYTVKPEALAAVFEEINTNSDFRKHHPDHSHKNFHIFRCSLMSIAKAAPSEMDANQRGCVWVDLADVPSICLYPLRVREHFREIAEAEAPLYLGSALVSF